MVTQLDPSRVAERQLDIRVSIATDVGGRTNNEDAVLFSDLPDVDLGEGQIVESMLLALADGMGGHQSGEIASQLAIDTTRDVVLADPVGDVVPLLKQAFRRANDQIFSAWQSEGFIPSKVIVSGYNTDQPPRERGWTHWHHLFTPRQLLTHGLLANLSSSAQNRRLSVVTMLN
ncbi:MAG TPA: hypothetical protein PK691_03240, partial [Thermomicrobiales bacterium]|nr:hypothetical protein [Thermomicrobiales bacterium]